MLLFYGAPSLVSLGSFEGCDEGVRERRLLGMEERGRGCWEPIEGHIEAKLKSSALKRVRVVVRSDLGLLRLETSSF